MICIDINKEGDPVKKLSILALILSSLSVAASEEGKTLWEILVGSDQKKAAVKSIHNQVIENYKRAITDTENIRAVMGKVQTLDLVYLNRVYEWLEKAVDTMSTSDQFNAKSFQTALDRFYEERFNDFMEKYQVPKVIATNKVVDEAISESDSFLDNLFQPWNEKLENIGKKFGKRAVDSIDAAVKQS